METLKMHSLDGVQRNIELIGELFPNAITEVKRNGKVEHAIDFDVLRQELSDSIVEGREERYQFTWPDKKKAMLAANAPITATLRPVVADSVGKDGTPGGFDSENLYIEGDNLEVLKLLQETYLGKVKMIYIDPPYNTGNDFIYADDFMRSQREENQQMGMYDEDENRLFKNTDTNGKFHSDWCSMIYSRLMLARNLLTEDGVIFISINEIEQCNLEKICDEVFGSANHIATFVWKNKYGPGAFTKGVAYLHEYILCYGKNYPENVEAELSEAEMQKYKLTDDKCAIRGGYITQPLATKSKDDRPNLVYPLVHNGIEIWPDKQWIWEKKRLYDAYDNGEIVINEKNGKYSVRFKQYLKDENGEVRKGKPLSLLTFCFNQDGTKEMQELIGRGVFDFPKPATLIKYFLSLRINEQDDSDYTVLDFFSGSATTAHAVMQLNAEDGGHRKFIMVQLPEKCDEASEAYKAGYKNICEIGKERIRRAGEKIRDDIDIVHKTDLEEMQASHGSDDQMVMTAVESIRNSGTLTKKTCTYTDKETGRQENVSYESGNSKDFYRFHPEALDIGFRVLKLDDTNMKDVYYAPDDYDQGMLAGLESNIKDDRTDLDLLFGCLLDWGLPLSLPYKSEKIDGCTVHTYNDGDLIACFDANIPENVVKEIAKRKPLRAVFRDSGFASSPEKINVFEIFKLYMPEDANDISKRVRVI